MKKLIHVISDSNIGGAGKYLLTFLENYDKEKFECLTIVPNGSKLIPELEKLGERYLSCPEMAEKTFSRVAVGELKKIFKKEKPDIVHTHASLSARVAARLCNVKVKVYTRHSVFPQKKSLTQGVGKLINGIMAKTLSNRIIAVCDAAKQNLTDTGITDKIIDVIYNGVNPVTVLSEKEKNDFRNELGILADEKVCAIIARLNIVKGHEYFIEAAKLVKESGIKARFVIAGTGEREQALKEYAKKIGAENVLFTGFLKDVYKLENIMDVQINASFGTEAASLSLLEGMSLGKPAVVSDFGGNPELIENGINGFVVPQKDSKALAERIIEILKNEEQYKLMSDNSVGIYNERFTSKIMTENTEKVYLKILNGGRKNV